MVWRDDIDSLQNPATNLPVSASNWVTPIWRSFQNFEWQEYVPAVVADDEAPTTQVDIGDGELVAKYIRWGNIGFWKTYFVAGPNTTGGGDAWCFELPAEWDGEVTAIAGMAHSWDSDTTADYEGFAMLDSLHDRMLHPTGYVPTGNRVFFPRFGFEDAPNNSHIHLPDQAQGAPDDGENPISASCIVFFNE